MKLSLPVLALVVATGLPLAACAQQSNAALTPAESKAVLGERDKMMQTMRANMPPRPDGAMAGPNGAGPNGPPPNGGPNNADHPRRMGRMSTPGGFLLSLGVSREKM